jgi:modification methylase
MDCLEGLGRIEDSKINCIVTSPPYNLGGDFHTFVNGKRVTYGDYSGFKDKLTESDYQEWQINVLNECHRVLKDDGVMFYNHKNRIVKGTVISPLEWIHRTKFNVNQIIIMNLKSTANVDKRRFFPVYELIYVLTKEKGLKLNNYECLTDVWEVKKVPRKVSGHPATFHDEVPRRCIAASTVEGDIVLDPFSGSGTTCKVAKLLNRQYIGFEISEEYHSLSEKNIHKLV